VSSVIRHRLKSYVALRLAGGGIQQLGNLGLGFAVGVPFQPLLGYGMDLRKQLRGVWNVHSQTDGQTKTDKDRSLYGRSIYSTLTEDKH